MTLRTARHLLAAVALAAAILVGCDLPQNRSGGSGDTAADGADGATGTRTWRMLRLTDDSDAEPSPLPGADVDAIVAFTGDDFLFAGCHEASLFGQDRARYPDNQHADPWDATLAVREQGTAGGFVSLGGGHLLCELAVPVETGDRVVIWEMGGDGDERWRAAFAESAEDDFVGAGTFEGSAEVVAP